MSDIRPLQAGDLPQVLSLYERVMRSGSPTPPPGLGAYFERTLLDHPWTDPELPSLVHVDEGGRIVGFIGSYVRRMRFDGEPIRLACSGQLVADPASRDRAVGALLMREYLGGPQDLTITDGATDRVRQMWGLVGGVTSQLRSLSWTKVFRPAGFVGDRLLDRRHQTGLLRLLRPAWAAPDALLSRLPTRTFATKEPRGGVERLGIETMLACLPAIVAPLRLYPDYDAPYLEWLFGELARVEGGGELVARLVRADDGKPLGWYVAHVPRGAIAQVLQVVARERDLDPVLDHLLHETRRRGATAARGRVEPELLAPLAARGCLFRYVGNALIHSRRPEVLAAATSTRSLLTPLEGESWTEHHLLRFA
ncbi:MAG: hypothetical protein H0V40_04445 [Actinobacteria bacterium]|nr:hypothetical protein [Actinomycetota bacterium]